MLHAKVIDSKNQKIEIKNAEEFLKSSKFGALIYFVGTVRNVNEDKKVTGITYDSKDSLVIKSFEEIYKESDEKLNIKDKAVFIEHIKGYVGLEEKSILIGVGCKHRDQAYVLSRFIDAAKGKKRRGKKPYYKNKNKTKNNNSKN